MGFWFDRLLCLIGAGRGNLIDFKAAIYATENWAEIHKLGYMMIFKSQINTILKCAVFPNTPKTENKNRSTQFPTGFITSNFIIETSSLQDKHLFNYFRENDIS
jgi:hypothetical protein